MAPLRIGKPAGTPALPGRTQKMGTTTFYIPPGALRLPGLTCVHPLSKMVADDGITPGQFYDAGRGEELETVEVQLLGCRPDRVFYMPSEKPAQLELLTKYQEIALASGDRICSSSNGRESTSGVYLGEACATCPHVRPCSERIVALVHLPGDVGFPRELPISWASQGALTQMLVSGGARPWTKVFTLKGSQRENSKKGVSIVIRVEATRDATEEEIAAAETVLSDRVEPYLDNLMAPAQTALPEGQAGTARGVTISHEPGDVAIPMGPVENGNGGSTVGVQAAEVLGEAGVVDEAEASGGNGKRRKAVAL